MKRHPSVVLPNNHGSIFRSRQQILILEESKSGDCSCMSRQLTLFNSFPNVVHFDNLLITT